MGVKEKGEHPPLAPPIKGAGILRFHTEHGNEMPKSLGFALQNAVGAGEDHRDGGHHAFGVIHARLAQFLS